ncbi:MAG: type II secretion system protein [Synergistaceae bacterium]|nr:type II secretion system protein [Synergistaceae bacterium]
MKRRKGETLVEFIMAMYIFAMVMTWVVGFITGQTQAFVNIKNRSDAMYYAQRFMNISRDESGTSIPAEAIRITVATDKKTLTVIKGTDTTMTFRIAP